MYLLIWVLLYTLASAVQWGVYYDDESSYIVVAVFNERNPELIHHFRFLPTETDLIEKSSAFCSGLSFSDATCGKVLSEARGRLAQWWKYETVDEQNDIKHYYEYQLGVPSVQQTYPRLKTNYCFVTAFYDLGRHDWQHGYERSVQNYLQYFTKLVQVNIPLIVFIDDRYYSDLTKLINQYNYRQTHILLIPINESFLEQNIQSWQYLSTDEAIMRSSQYKAAVANRPKPNTPETLYPRYTCFTHAKIDFVTYVLNNRIALTSYHSDSSGNSGNKKEEVRSVDYLGWIDFGYLHKDFEIIPFEMNEDMLMKEDTEGDSSRRAGMELDYITEYLPNAESEEVSDVTATGGSDISVPDSPSSLSAGTTTQQYPFHMMINGELTPEDGNPHFTLMHAPVKVLGCFFFAHTATLLRYADLYHRSVRELHSRGIADDEQAIMAYLYWKEPTLFTVWRNLNLIENEEYMGWFVAHILYNKRMTKKNAVRLYTEANNG